MIILLISVSSYFPINLTLKLTQVSTLYDACLIWNAIDRPQIHTLEVLSTVHYNATFNEILSLTYWDYKILSIYRSCWIHDYYLHSSKSWKSWVGKVWLGLRVYTQRLRRNFTYNSTFIKPPKCTRLFKGQRAEKSQSLSYLQ